MINALNPQNKAINKVIFIV